MKGEKREVQENSLHQLSYRSESTEIKKSLSEGTTFLSENFE